MVRYSRAPSTCAGTLPCMRVPDSRVAVDLKLAAHLCHDRPADRQSKPVAVGLGREERFLDLVQMLLGDAASCVFDDQLDRRAVALGRDRQSVARWVASRALLTRFNKSCSTSAWTPFKGGRSAGISTISVTPRRSRLSRRIASTLSAAWLKRHFADILGRATGDIEHAAEDAATDLDRPLKLGEVCRRQRRVEDALVDLRSQLLHERKHSAECIVHVVRYAACQVGHRMLALGNQYSLLQ